MKCGCAAFAKRGPSSPVNQNFAATNAVEPRDQMREKRRPRFAGMHIAKSRSRRKGRPAVTRNIAAMNAAPKLAQERAANANADAARASGDIKGASQAASA
jgi:hypothetical protein